MFHFPQVPIGVFYITIIAYGFIMIYGTITNITQQTFILFYITEFHTMHNVGE